MRFVVRSIQGKLTAVSLALIAVIILVSGAVLEVMLRRAMDARLEAELLRHVSAIEAVLTGVEDDTRGLALAEDLSRAADCPTGPRELLAPGTPENFALREAEPTACGILLPHLGTGETLRAQQVWEDAMVSLLEDAPARERLGQAAVARMEDFDLRHMAPAWGRVVMGPSRP